MSDLAKWINKHACILEARNLRRLSSMGSDEVEITDDGSRLIRICSNVADSVSAAISGMVGAPEGGAMVKMGADGTPTKTIDKVAEDAAFHELMTSGESFRVLSEEMGEAVVGDSPEHFVHLDPLDGTFNAVKGIPFYSVSIFIKSNSSSIGYVRDLARGISYFAEEGHGAYKESPDECRKMRVSALHSLKDYSVSAYTIRPNTGRIVAIGDVVRRIRTLGSASLELCYLAEGMLDAFLDLRGALRAVDVAAGVLIVREAGGQVTDGLGKRLHLSSDMWQRATMIASSGAFHRCLIDLVGEPGFEESAE
jgi:myo-inositol-1(or 4)-monophosphatase